MITRPPGLLNGCAPLLIAFLARRHALARRQHDLAALIELDVATRGYTSTLLIERHNAISFTLAGRTPR